jgi:hypothetical protein
MASFSKLPSGAWRVQVRHKGRYVSETFHRREDARRWATDIESRIDRGETPTSARARGVASFGELIDLHVADMKEVGKAPGRSKEATLAMLGRELGAVKMTRIDRDCLVQFGRKRAAQGAGPSRSPWTSARSAWCSPTPRRSTACRCPWNRTSAASR